MLYGERLRGGDACDASLKIKDKELQGCAVAGT